MPQSKRPGKLPVCAGFGVGDVGSPRQKGAVMASTRFSPITRSKFRVERVMRDWAEVLVVIREAAERSDYGGPTIEAVERVGQEIAEIRGALLDWLIVTAAKGRPMRR